MNQEYKPQNLHFIVSSTLYLAFYVTYNINLIINSFGEGNPIQVFIFAIIFTFIYEIIHILYLSETVASNRHIHPVTNIAAAFGILTIASSYLSIIFLSSALIKFDISTWIFLYIFSVTGTTFAGYLFGKKAYNVLSYFLSKYNKTF